MPTPDEKAKRKALESLAEEYGAPKPLIEENPLELSDRYVANPVRAGVKAALQGNNPFTAAVENRPTSGQDVAHQFLSLSPQLGVPDPSDRSKRIYPLEEPLGVVAEMGLDPTNLTPEDLMHAVAAAEKLLGAGKASLAMIHAIGKARKVKDVEELLRVADKKGLLYHTTTKDAAEKIAQEGLVPQHGANTADYVKGFADDSLQTAPPMSFMSEQPQTYYSKFQIEKQQGIPEATSQDIVQHGGAALFSPNQDTLHATTDGLTTPSGKYRGEVPIDYVDLGDYVSTKTQKPDYVVTGQDLLDLLAHRDPDFLTHLPDAELTAKRAEKAAPAFPDLDEYLKKASGE
jgi:hypothetical protein